METLKRNSTRIAQILGILVALFLLVSFIGGYWFGWTWTGFWDYVTPAVPEGRDFQRQKTLWDWMQLLIIPAFLVGAAYWLNREDKKREVEAATKRAEEERAFADERAKLDRALADERAQAEREIAADSLREAALQAYFDRMSELILDKELRQSELNDEIRAIARARTLTVLRQLDEERKGSLIRFLYEANLINGEHDVFIDLRGADLSGAILKGALLDRASLTEVDLSGADLSESHLYNAVIDMADMSGAVLKGVRGAGAYLAHSNLSRAMMDESYLPNVDLSEANLTEVRLRSAYLKGAKLHKADLSNASLLISNLTSADLSYVNLRKTYLSGAILQNANLRSARLDGAILMDTDLSDANLIEAHLREADLKGAVLNRANLTGAKITLEQLAQVASLKGAIMPDGTRHD